MNSFSGNRAYRYGKKTAASKKLTTVLLCSVKLFYPLYKRYNSPSTSSPSFANTLRIA